MIIATAQIPDVVLGVAEWSLVVLTCLVIGVIIGPRVVRDFRDRLGKHSAKS